jgi:hypothetical protein
VRAVLAIMDFSTGYQLLGLLHILAAVVAFGPMLIYPTVRGAGDTAALARLHTRMTMPALVLLWVLGMGLAGMSKPKGSDEIIYHMSQTWLILAIVDWLILVAVGWFLIRPSITDASESATKRFQAGVGITHIGLVVGVALMIWKPGL